MVISIIKLLNKSRNISFEQIVVANESDDIIAFLQHHNSKKYPDQIIVLVNIDDYVYAVPCVMNKESIFLKTIYPSRKYTKLYLNK
ncbi:MAG TPA: toxin [Spirochaetota bacterium]|nr:toxin [Spirochaetota bacterium]HOR44943.1 toxin [Spirochaetota bacterium]HPJ13476.1 toxin [Spirochaetota bacterium]HPK56949.1 toxin [Spirochaetota bacterium]HPM33407.1 toxin [Spirochaetota bacterium]